jgi:hypothetical protein
MSSVIAAAALAAVLAGSSAAAAECTAGRYAFAPAEEGMFRLDTESGEITRCTTQSDGYLLCAAAEMSGQTQDSEAPGLKASIQALAARMAALEAMETRTQPGNEAMQRIAALAERMMGRVFALVREVKGAER